MVVYFHDILTYSTTKGKHIMYLQQVLKALQKNELFISSKKCFFMKESIVFFGYIITTNGIKVDEENIQGIKDWFVSSHIREVWSFHGFASFYRRFIQNFNSI